MSRMKKSLFVFTAILVMLPGFLTTVSAENDDEVSTSTGQIDAKDEVVYGTLSTTGEQENMYIVNKLEVTKAGKVEDYGDYSSVKNLTDLSELEQSDDTVQISAPEGKFYYQGNMDNTDLPWQFSISYFLDGEPISPERLAGEDGHLQIEIETTENQKGNSTFFENYLLQISLTFDSEKTSNIKAEDGTMANTGKNEQVTFTVMPEQEEELVVEADVEQFELEGIEMTGIPSTMDIDAPDTDEMTSDVNTLASAIADVNDGVAALKDGVTELNGGTSELKEGSRQYKNGIAELDDSSTELVDGSEEIYEALTEMNRALDDIDDMDLSELEQLGEGFSEMSNGIEETADGMAMLKENYNDAYDILNEAMDNIPSHDISEDEIKALYQSGADEQTINKLVETYEAAQFAKGTYNEVKQAFDVVDTTLETIIDSLNEMADHVDTVADELNLSFDDANVTDGLVDLTDGVNQLAESYKQFHDGLVEYTGGVSQLSSSFSDIDNGIGALSNGTNELKGGVEDLHKGTRQLKDSTINLPEEMTEEIDEMIAEYDKPDFDAVSFVSPKNKNIDSVQFVLKTESIELDESEPDDKQETEEKGLWDRFKELFL